jgi:hypothetical protein
MKDVVLAIGLRDDPQAVARVRARCVALRKRLFVLDDWSTCRVSLYPASGDFEMRFDSSSDLIRRDMVGAVLHFGSPRVPMVSEANRAYQGAEYEALLFGLCFLSAPRVAARWAYNAAAMSDTVQPTSVISLALVDQSASDIFARRGPGEVVIRGSVAVHRAPDGTMDSIPLPSAGSRPGIEVTVVSDDSLHSHVPYVGLLPTWITTCDAFVDRLLQDSFEQPSLQPAPAIVTRARRPDGLLSHLIVLAHTRDTTAAHLFYRAFLRRFACRFLDLTHALSPRCSSEEFEDLQRQLAEAPFVFARPLPTTTQQSTAADPVSTRLGALLRSLQQRSGPTINAPAAGYTNISKSAHLSHLSMHGLRVPETLVTNDPSAVAAFYRDHDALVYKSGSRARSVASIFRAPDLERLDRLSLCPALFQERIRGPELRIHTLFDAAFSLEIQSSGLDYRFSPDTHRQEGGTLSPAGTGALADVAQASGLSLSGCDLKWHDTRNQWMVLEMNRMPAIDFFDHPGTSRIADAIINLGECSPSELAII